ncbi:hypothetical protein [Streptomyces sp. NPDC093591]|uniref:hypothetical protein n=1 Tax=Streptomyces sp. NPDC093591 TaxID=3366044 RepID=UPI003810B1C5
MGPAGPDAGFPEASLQGYHGQLILSSGDLAEMGELKDVRRAAREAGRRLGWQPKTRVVDDEMGAERQAGQALREALVAPSSPAEALILRRLLAWLTASA